MPLYSITMLLASAVQPVPTVPAADAGFTFDTGKYAYLTVQLVANDGTVYNQACPKKETKLLEMSFRDILFGEDKRNAAITIEIGLPNAELPKIKLDPLTVAIRPRSLGRSSNCEIFLHSFHYSSPLFNMAKYEHQNFSIRTALYRQKEGAPFFADTLSMATSVINKFSPVPADAIVKADALGELARKTLTNEARVSTAQDFKIARTADNPVTAKDWTISGGIAGLPDNIVIRIRLRTRDALFEKSGSVWTSAWVLQTSFPAATSGARDVSAYLTNVASTEWSEFRQANTIEGVKPVCANLFQRVNEMGLSTRDNALLKWALVRGHPTLNMLSETAGKLDRLPCMDGVWAQLPKEGDGALAALPVELTQRPEVAPKIERFVTEVEMSSTVEGSGRFAKFFRAASWRPQRADAAVRLFSSPHVVEAGGFPLLATEQQAMADPAGWLGYQWNTSRPLATNIGCYSWSGSATSDVPPGTMYAVGKFLLGEDGQALGEAMMRVTFAKLAATGPGEARISKIEFMPKPDIAMIKAVKSRHGTSCGDSDWSPDILK